MSIVGARPNFMKVAPIHRAFLNYSDKVEHKIVHTGQHYDSNMSDAFFKDLEMPEPAYFLGVGSGSHAEQTAKVMLEFEKICIEEKPDLVLVVGDVNSTAAAAITAVKLGAKVAHVEAGLRSRDRSMPEEINRLVADAVCDYAFVTEPDAIKNLKSESFPEENLFFVGNTMIDSQKFALPKAEKSDILKKLGLDSGDYFLFTIHRPSNVDDPNQLAAIIEILNFAAERRPTIFPIHPRTRKNAEKFGLADELRKSNRLKLLDPVGYVDFLALTKSAFAVLTDSGGIQEETTALGVQCATLRPTTERPITVEIGTNIMLDPYDKEEIKAAIEKYDSGFKKVGKIPEFWDGKAAERIAERIVDLIGG